MLLSAVDVLVVMPWCGQRDVGALFIGGLSLCRDSAAFKTPLPLMKFWYSSLDALAPPSMHKVCRCGDFIRWILHCLAVKLTA